MLNQSSHQEMGTTTSDMGYHYFWFLDAIKAGLLTKENTGLPIGSAADYVSSEFMGPKVLPTASRTGGTSTLSVSPKASNATSPAWRRRTGLEADLRKVYLEAELLYLQLDWRTVGVAGDARDDHELSQELEWSRLPFPGI